MKIRLLLLLSFFSLGGCMTPTALPNDPAFAPTYPAQPIASEFNGGSLYQEGFGFSLYDDRKAYRVGDIITVQLDESTQANKKADTDFSKETTASISEPTAFGKTFKDVFGFDVAATLDATREHEGESESSQSNSLRGNITVTVSEVLPNGLLKIRGEKWLTLNQGDEYVRISGLVRPDDVDTDNMVSSQKIADARISYAGTGSLADSNEAGWLTKLFNSPAFPF
ncbi:flagellar basal body L-ring protein FlgH [Aestuariirhabdus sp. Z084]|uniref:flagellar basal body L-ring protein FlgH n=1 Tax=Aestuariirhabdus haliotis TaxID=2918751 RepID=UPI00201B38FB|nr:flagellar basal body L-ring protein FlgH [Aestuariirhabdus haliotis]MCL6414446.1 flagellar basal body L-ring protein FlgH [Aestuariirhabdus haliotis]MCL6418572.1 flagellar basal body L-ring protein FlgH [Aestuariirhabdus haliotis]